MTPAQSAHRRSTILAGALLGLALLLLIHRYPGINHDASLYLGQALHRLRPDIFGHDLFFAYGSQDSFTLMPWLVSLPRAWLSFPDIFLWGTWLSLLAFAGFAWLFLSRILPREHAYWGWLALIALPGAYGVIRVFTYGEAFLTARPLSEAICLLALGCLARSRWLLAASCFLGAGLLHPLQAMGALLIAWPWMVLQDRRWLHLAWSCLPVLALGFTSIKPFDGLYQVIDPAWLKDLTDFTMQLFVTQWYQVDWANLAFDIIMLAYASWRLRDAFGQWCLAGLAGLVLGISATLLLADLMHLALPTALQFWRAQWLAHLLANASIGVLLCRDLLAGNVTRSSLLALVATMAGTGILWAWIPVFAVYAAWPRLSTRMTPTFRTTITCLAWLAMLALFAYHVANEWLPFRIAHYRLELYAIDRRILAFPLLALGLPLLGIWLWKHSRVSWQRVALIAVAALAAAAGCARWDARSPVARALEAQSPNPELFGVSIPENAQVFWDLPLYPAVWVALERADYFSPWQLAGSVFNRGTPREGRLRLERVRPVIEEDMYCQSRSVPIEERANCRISDVSLRHACGPGANRPPDFLVLPYRQGQPALGHWSVIDPATNQPATTFWLYDCSALMRTLAPGRGSHGKGTGE